MALKGAIRSLSEIYGVPSNLDVRGSACAKRSPSEQVECLGMGEIHLEAMWFWVDQASVTADVIWSRELGVLLMISTAQRPEPK
jgi:hypothetical protein